VDSTVGGGGELHEPRERDASSALEGHLGGSARERASTTQLRVESFTAIDSPRRITHLAHSNFARRCCGCRDPTRRRIFTCFCTRDRTRLNSRSCIFAPAICTELKMTSDFNVASLQTTETLRYTQDPCPSHHPRVDLDPSQEK
jgi:hypothetical protein